MSEKAFSVHAHLAPGVIRVKSRAGGGVEVRCGKCSIGMTAESSPESNRFIV